MDDDKGSNSGSAYVFTFPFPNCDASIPPANGAVGDCTSALESGSSCQPTCDAGYAASGPSVCENGVLVPAICIPLCDASSPPANGAVGDCTDQLLSGTTCQPTCDAGYFAPEPSVCENGVLTPAVCTRYCDASSPPANGGVGDCMEYMLSGTTCQPTCDALYFASGPSVCEDGVLSPAVCTLFLSMIQERAKVIASDAAANRKFGWSVSIDGDMMVVGAEGASAAYVFTRNLASDWTQVDKLTPDVAVAEFGKSVSIDGDTIVVGAPGTAYVFTRNSPGDLTSTWSQSAQLLSPATGSFGMAVAIDGDTIAVGDTQAPRSNTGDPAEGAVYIFTRTGNLTSSWYRLPDNYGKISFFGTEYDKGFGNSVAMYGNSVAIGATGHHEYFSAYGIRAENVGRAFVAYRTTPDDLNSAWTYLGYSSANSNRMIAGLRFGTSVSIDRDTMVIGAFGSGVRRYAEIWTRTSGCLRCGWTRRQQLDLPGVVGDSQAGISVAVDGDTVVIGSHYDGDDSRGTAYVYRRDTPGDLASGWTQHTKLTVSDGVEMDQFGWSVAIDGSTVVIGALKDEDKASSVTDSGAVYVFELIFSPCDASIPPANGAVGDCTSELESGSSCQPTCDAGYAASGPSTCEEGYLRPAFCTMYPQRAKLTGSYAGKNHYFGRGDMSIDGDTIVVGVPYRSSGSASNVGEAYVYVRDTPGDLASGWTEIQRLLGTGSANQYFGDRTAVQGDTIAISQTRQNAVRVYRRTTPGDLTSTFQQVVYLQATDSVSGDSFGAGMSISGDTMVVGAFNHDSVIGSTQQSDSGAAYVFRRDTPGDPTSTWTEVVKLTASDGVASGRFGKLVSLDGDTVAIAATKDGSGSLAGAVYVFTRNSPGELTSNWTQVAKLTPIGVDPTVTSWTNNGGFGEHIALDGDTVVVGARYDDDMGSNTGAAYVYVRETPGELSSNWRSHQKLTASDASADNDAMFGSSLAIDGDMIVIGAYQDDTDKGDSSGSVYMFTLTTPGDPTSTWTQHRKLTASDGATDDNLGYQGLAIDGETIVVGAYGVDGIDSGTGAAYVFSSLPSCDASAPPANGAVGDCTSKLIYGGSCQPACDAGYAPTGPTVCDDGVLTPAVCSTYCDASAPPANGEVGNCTEYLLSGTTCQPTCEEYHTVSGVTTCEDGTITRARCDGPCDASAPPANGGAGNCTDKLMRGTECQPTCDEHYTVSGVSKCVGGTLIPAQCLGPCDMDTCCYFYNKRRGFNVPGTCAHLEYTTPSPPPPAPPPPPPPLPPAGFRTVNERVLVQDQDGWLLMAAYNHQAGTNPNLVSGTTPSSATEGFSHIWPGTHLGLTASDIAEVRFYCHTSNHNRVINFSVNNDWVKTAILTGSISGNSVTYWTSGTTKLDGHTANLPDSTTMSGTVLALRNFFDFRSTNRCCTLERWGLGWRQVGMRRSPQTTAPTPCIRFGSSWRSRPSRHPCRTPR